MNSPIFAFIRGQLAKIALTSVCFTEHGGISKHILYRRVTNNQSQISMVRRSAVWSYTHTHHPLNISALLAVTIFIRSFEPIDTTKVTSMKHNLATVVQRSCCTILILLAAGFAASPAFSELANISSRAFVGTDDAVLIPGFIVNGESDDYLILVQGPSLVGTVPNALADPRLEVRNQETGELIAANDNWEDGPSAAQIAASGLELDPLEPDPG